MNTRFKQHFHRVTLHDLAVGIWHASTAKPKTPMLFFNGIGANMEMAEPLAQQFPDRDLITFDMPGIGSSSSARFPYRVSCLANVTKKILQENGYDKVDVVGVSWGGGPAQQFAIQYSGMVNRLILAATTAGMLMIPGKPSALLKMVHPKRYTDSEYLKKNFEILYGHDRSEMVMFNENAKSPTKRGYLNQVLAMVGWTSVPFLPFIKKKTLIMAGTKDRIVPMANAHILNTLLPNSEIYAVEGGHLFLVSQAESCSIEMKRFLDAA